MNTLKLTTFLLIFPLLLTAQRSKEVGAFVGVSQYQGDLAPSPIAANETKPAIGGAYRYLFNSNFGIRGTATWGKYSGQDRNRIGFIEGERDWSVSGSILELAVHSEWNFFGTTRYNNTGLYARQYSPFISVGLGVALANMDLIVPSDDRNKIPEPDATSTFLVVPISAGLRLDITEDFVVTAEFGSRAIFSDYLDGVSKNGNPKTNDWYFFTGISLFYVLEELVGGKFGR
ncbi:MAG: hypothetical protein IPJ74_11540 [Saprospiraceae bacterium]|nr:hypothetical protein [Saprospiraceae bacterium]